MKLFSRPYANNLHLAMGSYGFRQINYLDARDLRHKKFAAVHYLKTLYDKIYSLFNRYKKTGHPFVSYRNNPVSNPFSKKGHYTTPPSHYISVSDHAEFCLCFPYIRITDNKQFIRTKFS